MSKWDKFVEDILPIIFGIMGYVTVASVMVGVTAWSIRFMLNQLGVNI